MRGNAVEFGKDRSNVVSAWRYDQSHHLLDCFDPHQTIGNGCDVVKPVPIRGDHCVHAIFGNLLHAAMKKTDVAIEIHYSLAVEFQDDAQHTVRRWMLRAHIEDHLRAIEQGLLSCSDLYLVHKNLRRTCPISF